MRRERRTQSVFFPPLPRRPDLPPPAPSLIDSTLPSTRQPKPRTKRRKADEDGSPSPSSSDDDGGGGAAAGGHRRTAPTSHLPADLSAKVLREARAQQAEVEVEDRGTRGLGGGKVG